MNATEDFVRFVGKCFHFGWLTDVLDGLQPNVVDPDNLSK